MVRSVRIGTKITLVLGFVSRQPSPRAESAHKALDHGDGSLIDN